MNSTMSPVIILTIGYNNCSVEITMVLKSQRRCEKSTKRFPLQYISSMVDVNQYDLHDDHVPHGRLDATGIVSVDSRVT